MSFEVTPDEVSTILDFLVKIGTGIASLASAKTAADRTAAFAQLKADVLAGEATFASIPAQRAAEQAEADRALADKFPPAAPTPTIAPHDGPLPPPLPGVRIEAQAPKRDDEPTNPSHPSPVVAGGAAPVVAAGDEKSEVLPVLKPVDELK